MYRSVVVILDWFIIEMFVIGINSTIFLFYIIIVINFAEHGLKENTAMLEET